MKKISGAFAVLAMMSVLTSMSVYAATGASSFYKENTASFIFDYSDPYGFYPPGDLEEVTYNGYLALGKVDLDGDGEKELLTVSIKPDTLEEYNLLIAEVYELQFGDWESIAQYTLAQDVLKSDSVNCSVFLIPRSKNKGYFVCCENKEEENAIYSKRWWQFRVCKFDGEDFIEYADVTVSDESSKKEQKNAKKACENLGIYSDQMITTPLADQNFKGLIKINTITRKPEHSIKELINSMNSGNGSVFYYGNTVFKSYINENLNNKREEEFPDRIVYNTQNSPSYLDYPFDDSDEQEIENSGSSLTDSQYDTERYDNEDPYRDYSSYSREFVISDSDTRLLTEEDLWGLSANELRIARNEIYARHGRIFNNLELSTYFESTSWYKGTVPADRFTYEYAQSVFSSVEIANIDFIRQYEEMMQE